MSDNQESKELCACIQPDWVGSYDGLFCGVCKKFCSADARAIKEAELQQKMHPKACCKEYVEHLETTYIGYSLHEKLLNEGKEQLTATQQKLDVAVEALKEYAEAEHVRVNPNTNHKPGYQLRVYTSTWVKAKAALAT